MPDPITRETQGAEPREREVVVGERRYVLDRNGEVRGYIGSINGVEHRGAPWSLTRQTIAAVREVARLQDRVAELEREKAAFAALGMLLYEWGDEVPDGWADRHDLTLEAMRLSSKPARAAGEAPHA